MARVGTDLDMARLRAEWLERERAVVRQSEQVESQLREVLDTTSEGFMVLDREWRYAYINRQGAEMARRRPDGLIGRNVWEEFPEAAGILAQPEFERAMRDHIAVYFEMFYAPTDHDIAKFSRSSFSLPGPVLPLSIHAPSFPILHQVKGRYHELSHSTDGLTMVKLQGKAW